MIGLIRGEEDGSDDGFELHVDTGLGGRLLDDGLRLLARRIDRRLEEQLEPPAISRADAVGPALPARGVQDLIGAIDAELRPQILRLESTRQVEEIGGELPEPPVDLLLDG